MSQDCKNLLTKMLTYSPEKRISASQALRSRFIRKINDESDVTDADLLLSMNNLRNFRTQTRLQNAVLTYCASQQLSQKAEAKIRKLFDIFDTNKDGKLSTEEVLKGYTSIFGNEKKAKKEVERMMKNGKFNNSGVIEYNGKQFKTKHLRISRSKHAAKSGSERREFKRSI